MWNSVAYGGNVFVAVADNCSNSVVGKIVNTEDGIHFLDMDE